MTTDDKSLSVIPMGGSDLPAIRELREEFTYEASAGKYVVYSISGTPLVENDDYRLAVVKNPSGQFGVAMIGIAKSKADVIDTQVRMCTTLQKIAADLDEEALSAGDKPPYYGALFPIVLDMIDTGDGRTGVFLGYHESIETYKQLAPMVVALIDRCDLQSAAWILGKLLKLLGFLHDLNFVLGYTDQTNLFLELDQHGVFAFDLSAVNEYPSEADKTAEVGVAARIVWEAAGGTELLAPPFDEAIMTLAQHEQFVEFLQLLMLGKTSAAEAHRRAYEMFDEIWPKAVGGTTGGLKRNFHPWMTYPRTTR